MIPVNNEEKILNLIEMMYSEFSSKFDNLEKEVLKNRESIAKLENEVLENRHSIVKLENNLTEKIRALFDSRAQINSKLDCLDEKIDKLQMDVNNLTIKTAYNDNRIIEISKNLKNAK